MVTPAVKRSFRRWMRRQRPPIKIEGAALWHIVVERLQADGQMGGESYEIR